ncbi:MAG: hypothetical protein FJ206_03200 [Gemmatimonadetes bacterium]|nr:hypothetical protein [Gemmatimonadota bacterium]
MTRNLYPGADLDAVIAALANGDPSDDQAALFTAIQTFTATDYQARMRAIAAEIDAARPHVVGLQEVAKIDIDLTGLGLPVVIHADFLASLEAALAARGLKYRVAARNHNFTVAPFGGAVSLRDDDAMLVAQGRVNVHEAMGGTFAANIGVVAPGIDIRRGWVGIRARIDGLTYRIASAHPESGGSPGLDLLRAAQLTELVNVVGQEGRRVIIGDLNDDRGSAMYQVLEAAGYRDAWPALRPADPGFTCCHAADLANPVAVLTQHRDYVFAAGLDRSDGGLAGEIRLVGNAPGDRVEGPYYPIWPSDHAGVVARLGVRPPR